MRKTPTTLAATIADDALLMKILLGFGTAAGDSLYGVVTFGRLVPEGFGLAGARTVAWR